MSQLPDLSTLTADSIAALDGPTLSALVHRAMHGTSSVIYDALGYITRWIARGSGNPVKPYDSDFAHLGESTLAGLDKEADDAEEKAE